MLQLTVAPEGRPLALAPRRLLIAGYTGRDQAAVARHVDELREHGIPAPERTPAVYALTPDRLTTDAAITVVGGATSGEAEFVLLVVGGELYVGVGSDHTDRDLERVSVRRSKQVCPKPLGRQVWRWADVRDHWDACLLRSWSGGAPYQEGSVAALLAPEAVLAAVRERAGDVADSVVYCGTLPLLDGMLRFDTEFAAALADPALGQELRCAYTVSVVDDLD
ncbi:MAG TPA: DUF2848 family protein [Chloroflexota bacterium]|nr:DUF2848 family protein [Chloroflexota bacterium]